MTTLKSKPKAVRLVGFDTETINNNKDLLCCSLYCDGKSEFFRSKDEFFNYIFDKHSKIQFSNAYIFCTNLTFDFFSVFSKEDAFKEFDITERSSRTVICRSYIDYNKKKFVHPEKYRAMIKENKKLKDSIRPVRICDTINIFPASVEKLGEILNLVNPKHPIKKIDHPDYLGKRSPKNKKEWDYMKDYNVRDSEITQKFMVWFQSVINLLGGNIKPTIASISLDVFRRGYLKQWISQSSKKCINLEYKAFYGGRTEAYKRGVFEMPTFTYDVTSLYPAMMMNNNFPKPYGVYVKKIEIDQVMNNEGVCYAELYCPKHIFPLLPVKADKLYFSTGDVRGYYTFVEIREALKIGYTLLKLGEGSLYKYTFSPFKHFIKNFYDLRLKFQKQCNPCEKVVKVVMNSLFGKFGYKYKDKEVLKYRENFSENDTTFCSIIPYVEDIGLYRVITTEQSQIPQYVHPVISVYITAYGRIDIYNKMKIIGFDNVIYVDTDGVKTTRVLQCDGELGNFKIEDKYKKLVIVRPKSYAYITDKNKEIVKIKGCKQIDIDKTQVAYFDKFVQAIKENTTFDVKFHNFRGLRSAFISKSYVNELIEINKEFNMTDNKRQWDQNKITVEIQNSKPLHLTKEFYGKQRRVIYENVKENIKSGHWTSVT
jgi:hypothetical protein